MHLCNHNEEFLRLQVLSGGCYRAFLLTEEAFKQYYLTNTDDKQQDGFSDGPVGHPLQEVLCFRAVLCLSQPVPGLRVSHHLQDLMNGDARWLQLKAEKLTTDYSREQKWLGAKHTVEGWSHLCKHWFKFSHLLLNRSTSTFLCFSWQVLGSKMAKTAHIHHILSCILYGTVNTTITRELWMRADVVNPLFYSSLITYTNITAGNSSILEMADIYNSLLY